MADIYFLLIWEYTNVDRQSQCTVTADHAIFLKHLPEILNTNSIANADEETIGK